MASSKPFTAGEIAYREEWEMCIDVHLGVSDAQVNNWVAWVDKAVAVGKPTFCRFGAFIDLVIRKRLGCEKEFFP